MYINNSTQNIFLGGAPTTPQFGSGCSSCMGGMDPSQMLGSMQMMAASVMGMGFMGGGGMMPGGFAQSMSPNFGGMSGIGGAKATKQLSKAIKGLTKFLGKQAKMGKKKGKKAKKA